MQPVELRTERLILRDWTDADREPFAVLNADPEVMAHFPAPLARAESDAMVDRIVTSMHRRGFGLWVVEVVGGPACIGFVGLNPIPFDAGFTPALEVGWRLARPAWGQGYAPEAAVACVDFAFASVRRDGDDFAMAGPADERLDEVVSMTTPGNTNSRRVMEKIGLTRDPADDFDHPTIADRAPHLVRHVLYRVDRASWLQRNPGPAR